MIGLTIGCRTDESRLAAEEPTGTPEATLQTVSVGETAKADDFEVTFVQVLTPEPDAIAQRDDMKFVVVEVMIKNMGDAPATAPAKQFTLIANGDGYARRHTSDWRVLHAVGITRGEPGMLILPGGETRGMLGFEVHRVDDMGLILNYDPSMIGMGDQVELFIQHP